MRLILYLALIVSILCGLGNYLPRFEFVAHLQPWILAGITAMCVIAILKRYWVVSSLLLITTLYHVAFTASYISLHSLFPRDTSKDHGLPFRVLQFNINADNGRFDDLATAMEHAEADLMVICEANVHILGRLDHLHSTYPYRIEVARWPNDSILGVSGTILWSKYPFVHSNPLTLKEGNVQACHAVVEIEGQKVSIYAVHLLAPRTEAQIGDRDAGTHELAELLASDPEPNAMIIGDLNQSVWTPAARKLIKTARLQSILKGRMFMSTWPGSIYPFGIAIDHILYRGSMSCIGTGTLDGIGSDHRMLVAEMILTTPSKETTAP